MLINVFIYAFIFCSWSKQMTKRDILE